MQNIRRDQIAVGVPVFVSQASLGLRSWGPWQFPAIQRLPDGRLQIGYHVAADSATAYGIPPGGAISDDNGNTWTLMKPEETPYPPSWASKTLILPNGDFLRQVQLRSVPLRDIQEKLPPLFVVSSANVSLYLAKDMPKELDGFRFSRLKKGSDKWIEETAEVNIPGAVCAVTSGVLTFPWIQRIRIAPDGTLWGSGHTSVIGGALQRQSGVYFLRSMDSGHTWNLLSEISYQPDKKADKFWNERDGFTEPNITFLPDGSIFCLIRTTDGKGVGPLYKSRSTDKGKTWGKPVVFDDLGVWPALLTLKSGVTLASYGRPGLYIRASKDPVGKSWASRVIIVKPGKQGEDTCSYSDMIALSDHSALIVYSDFNYPDEQGKSRKTILVRKIILGGK